MEVRIKERKEHIVVDTLGLPVAMVIHPAIIHDSKGAVPVIKRLIGRFSDLKKRPADGGYRGPLAEFVKELGWDFEVVLRPQKSALKFMTLPLRWIVERTFSWIENYRRMTIDYKRCSESAEAMLHLSFCQILLKKLHR